METAPESLARKIFRVARTSESESDRDLLFRFISKRAEEAFAELVRRHGRMVLAVARRVTGHPQDAEDAFQATFLVLARKAGQIRKPDHLPSWLYGVAYRTALEARSARGKRLEIEVSSAPEREAPVPREDTSDLRRAIDEELASLPEKYRTAIVMCDLEGQSRTSVATRLKIPEGTLSSRLAHGRKVLAARLTRRGVTLAGGSLATFFALETAGEALPRELILLTARAASRFCKNVPLTNDVISPSVSHLTERGLKVMLANRMGLYSAGGLLVLGLVALGTFGFAQAPRPEGGQQYYPDQPGTRPGGPAGKQAAKFASKGIEDEDVPYDHLPSQAVVRIEEGKLVIRQRAKHIEVKSPVGEANSPFESPYKLRSVVSGQTFADPGELAVFDMKGNRLLPKVWKDKLKVDTHVLLAYDGKTPNPRELTLLREDVLLIILPAVSHPPYQYGAPSPAASLPYRPSSFVPAPAVHPPSSYPAVVPPVDVGDPLPSISVGPTQSTFPPSPAVNPLPPASQTLPPSTNPGVHSNRNQERRSSPPSSMENTPSDSAVSAKS